MIKAQVFPETLKKRKENFTELLVQRIESAYIENDDAVKILRSRNTVQAFHYVDPPYPNSDQGHYAGYTFDDYRLLLEFLANECKGKFLLSSYKSEMLDQFIIQYGWHKKEINLKLSGGMQTNARAGRASRGITHRTELLVSNYKSACGTIGLF